MKIFLAIIILSLSLHSQESKKHFRPQPQEIVNFLTPKLELNNKQQEKIKKALEKEAQKYDKLDLEFKNKISNPKIKTEELNKISNKMFEIYNNIPNTINKYLDKNQKIKFDELRNPQKKEGKKENAEQPKKEEIAKTTSTIKTDDLKKEDAKKAEESKVEIIDVFYP